VTQTHRECAPRSTRWDRVGKRARLGLSVLAFVCAALLARRAIAQMLVTFQSPHVVRAPTARMDARLGQRIDDGAAAAKIATPDDLVAFALHATTNALHFGLRHPTHLTFDPEEREGNCVEYAELFASTLNREHGKVDAHAWVVRSDARVLGAKMSDPAWRDHDWVLVVVRGPEGPRRLYVDPTLYGMGLGWDIAGAVRGDVRVPARESPLSPTLSPEIGGKGV